MEREQSKSTGLEKGKLVELLKPIEISEEARKLLGKWGVRDEQIDQLEKFTAGFDYAGVTGKVEKLKKEPVEISKEDGDEYARFPSFFNIGEGDYYMQCSDIAQQFISRINKSGLMDELNSNLEGGNKLVSMIRQGKSKTHFRDGKALHIWNALVLVGEDGYILDEDNEVYFDAAFQDIHTNYESEYKIELEPDDDDTLDNQQECTIQVGSIDIKGSEINFGEGVIIGASKSMKYVYDLSLARDIHTNTIRTIIDRVYENGEYDSYILDNDSLMTLTNPTENSAQETEEVKEILIKATGFNFVETENTHIG